MGARAGRPLPGQGHGCMGGLGGTHRLGLLHVPPGRVVHSFDRFFHPLDLWISTDFKATFGNKSTKKRKDNVGHILPALGPGVEIRPDVRDLVRNSWMKEAFRAGRPQMETSALRSVLAERGSVSRERSTPLSMRSPGSFSQQGS